MSINLLFYRAVQPLVGDEQHGGSFADRVVNLVHNELGFDDLFALGVGVEADFLFRFRGNVGCEYNSSEAPCFQLSDHRVKPDDELARAPTKANS